MDIMIDLETLGTSANTMILTFAAIAFNRSTGAPIGPVFYERVDIDSYKEFGPIFTLDFSTLSWWMNTAPALAKQEAFNTVNRKNIRLVMQNFVDWCSARGDIFIWSHGACFDVPIVSYTLKNLGMREPWKFWNVRDTRTMYDLVGVDLKTIPKDPQYPDHHALGDCIKQIKALKICFENLIEQKEDSSVKKKKV